MLLKALTEYLMIQEGVLRGITRLGAEALEIEKCTDIGKKEGYLSNPTSALAYFLRRLFYRGRADRLSDIYAEAAIHEVATFVEQTDGKPLSQSNRIPILLAC